MALTPKLTEKGKKARKLETVQRVEVSQERRELPEKHTMRTPKLTEYGKAVRAQQQERQARVRAVDMLLDRQLENVLEGGLQAPLASRPVPAGKSGSFGGKSSGEVREGFKEKRLPGGYNPVKAAGAAVQQGMAQFAQTGSGLLAGIEDVAFMPFELMAGQKIGEASQGGLMNRWHDSIVGYEQAVREGNRKNLEAGGKAAQILDDVGTATVAAVPQAVAALLTGGASLGAQSTAGLNMAAQSAMSPGVVTTVNQAVHRMAKDPQYWMSFAQTVGPSYQQAVAEMREKNGGTLSPADMTKATLYALGNGLAGAAVEVGGGIQTLPDELRHGGSAWRALVDTAVDEGKEEAVQGILERGLQGIYGKDNPLFSMTDPEAVLNPVTAGKEAALGGAVGLLLGGGQTAVQKMADYSVSSKKDLAAEQSRHIPYTQEEAAKIQYDGKKFKNIVAGVDSTVSAFFQRWRNGRKSHHGEKLEKLYLGKMSDSVKARVENILGYKMDSRDFILTNDNVKHILDEHGNPQAEMKKGNIPLEPWMLDALSVIVAQPDNVVRGHSGSGKNTGKTGVVFSKSFDNGTVVTIQFDNPGRGTMEVTTMYAKKEGTIPKVTVSSDTATRTPEAFGPVPSDPTVTQSGGEVNWAEFPNLDRAVNGETRRQTAEVSELDRAVETAREKALQSAYEAGKSNVPREKVELLDEAQERAYTAGRQAAILEEAGPGVVRDEYTASLDRKTVEELDTVAKALGVKVQFVDSVAGGQANAQIKDGAILMERGNPNPVRFLFGHEITHHLQEIAPTEYRRLREAAVAAMGDIENAAFARQAEYAEHDVELSYGEAVDELTADYVGRMMEDSGYLEEFIQRNRQDRTLLERLRDAFRELGRKLTGRYRTLAGQVEKRLTAAMEAGVKATAEKTAAGEGSGRFSLRAFSDGKRFVDVKTDQHLFDGLTDKEKTNLAIKVIKERFAGKVIGIDNRVFVNGRSASEYGHPVKNIEPDVRNAKMRLSTELDNLVDAGTNFRTRPDGADGHIHPNAVADFQYFDAIFKVGNEYYQGTVNIEVVAKGRKLKDVTKIRNITQDISSSYGDNPKSTFLRDTSMDSVSQNESGRKGETKVSSVEKTAAGGGSGRFSLRKAGGKNVVWIESSSLSNKELNNHKAVAAFIARHIGEVYTIIESGQKVYIGEDLPGEYTQSKYTSYLRQTDRTAARAKNKAVDGLGELIETATDRRWERTRHTQSKDAKYGMYRYDSTFAFPVKDAGGAARRVRAYDVELVIRNASDGRKYLYDIVNIKENTSAQIDLTAKEAGSAAHKAATGGSVSVDSVSQNESGRKGETKVSSVEKTAAGGGDGKTKYSLKDRISAEMSEEERYERLKDREIAVPHYNAEKMASIEEGGYEALENAGRDSAFKILRKIGEQFGVFKDYHNTDMELDFGFSKGNLRESVYKQGREFQNYARMMSVFDGVVENAVGIEAHENRYKTRGDQVKETFVFASAFQTDTGVIPVLLEVRTFTDNTKSALYVAVSLQEIERSRVIAYNAAPASGPWSSYTLPASETRIPDASESVKGGGEHQLKGPQETERSRIVAYNTTDVSDGSPYTLPASKLKLADIFANVKAEDGRMLKYLPDGFLNPEQRAAKQKALQEQKEYVDRKNAGRQNTPGGATFSLKLSGAVAQETERIIREGRENKLSDSEIQEQIQSAVHTIYQGMVRDYGAMKPGEQPFREVQAPRRTEKDKKVSQTVRTILEARATPEEALPDIEKLTADGVFSYSPYSDKQAVADAEAEIGKQGWNKSVRTWFDQVRRGEVSKALTTQGWVLYNNAANRGDVELAMDILDAMVKHQRSAAQAVQATRILKKLSPETQLYGVQRSVDSLQEDLKARYGKKAPELEIDRKLAEEYLRAKTQGERDAILADIYRDIGRQMPSKFLDKWNAWRYLAMLGNPRTHVRNIMGNLGFAPVVSAKNMTATAIEAMVGRISGGGLQRTKAIPGGKLLKAAWEDFANVKDMVMEGGKYDDRAAANQHIREGQRVFKNRALEAARRGNSAALEVEDMIFSKGHYAAALASYCKANGITAEQIAAGKGLDKAREYAAREAQKATYRDANAFSQFVSGVGRLGSKDSPYARGAAKLVEGVLPFRKTPANILVRGLEYSPLGLLNGIKEAMVDVRAGRKTGAEAIDSISAGMVGTGLLGLGIYLASQGWVRGSGAGDDKEKEQDKLMGHQDYALELPDGKSVTLDWLAPEALPFFMGVNLWEATRGDFANAKLVDYLGAVSQVTEPLLEMSMLQSLNDMFSQVGNTLNAGVKGLPAAISSAATSYLTQGLPTLLGQMERSGEDVRMTTYVGKNDFLTDDIQRALGKASARIPGWDFHQIPYIDAWGRQESTGDLMKRTTGNFLNPAYLSDIQESDMERELLRLYRSTGESVFPRRVDKVLRYDNQEKYLTAEEYVKYATKTGQTAREVMERLVDSPAYQKMEDGKRAEAVIKVYQYADAVGKESVSSYKAKGTTAKIIEANKKLQIKPEHYIALYLEVKDVSSLKDKNGESIPNSPGLLIMDILFKDKTLTAKQREGLYEMFDVGKTIRHYSPALVKNKLAEMRRKAG